MDRVVKGPNARYLWGDSDAEAHVAALARTLRMAGIDELYFLSGMSCVSSALRHELWEVDRECVAY